MTTHGSYPHVIRLLGPWEYYWSPQQGEHPPGRPAPHRETSAACAPQGSGRRSTARIQLTTSGWTWQALLEPQAAGHLRLSRSFHAPTRLDPDERVWLVVDGADPHAEVAFNGQLLGTTPGYALAAAWDITQRLSPRNGVELRFHLPPEASGALRPGRYGLPGGILGQVRLEVRRRQFLTHLAVFPAGGEPRPHLVVSGRWHGEPSPVPLSLRVVAAGRELAFHRLTPSGDFRLHLDPGPLEASWIAGRGGSPLHVQVDLLRGGDCVWTEARTTSLRSLDWDPGGPLRVAGHPVAIAAAPRYAAEEGDLALARATPSTAAALAFIPRGDYLAQADQRGAALAIYVPAAWAPDVCPRLAHHPAIVAWWTDAPPAALPVHSTAEGFFGRPWVDLARAGSLA